MYRRFVLVTSKYTKKYDKTAGKDNGFDFMFNNKLKNTTISLRTKC